MPEDRDKKDCFFYLRLIKGSAMPEDRDEIDSISFPCVS